MKDKKKRISNIEQGILNVEVKRLKTRISQISRDKRQMRSAGKLRLANVACY